MRVFCAGFRGACTGHRATEASPRTAHSTATLYSHLSHLITPYSAVRLSCKCAYKQQPKHKPALTTFWNTIYFYTASATAGNHSYDCARGPGETSHRERSGLTTTCGCLFGFVYKKKPT